MTDHAFFAFAAAAAAAGNWLWLKVPQITVADSCSFQIGEQRFRLNAGG